MVGRAIFAQSIESTLTPITLPSLPVVNHSDSFVVV